MNISEKIKILRLKNDLKSADVSKYMEVSTETMRLWESGQSIPRNRNIFKLAKILNVDVDLLKNDDLNITDDLILTDENDTDFDYAISAKEKDNAIYSSDFKEILNKNGYLVGKKLTKIRLDRGFTQKELANGAETVQGTISRIEKGELQSVSIKILKRVTDFLGTDLSLIIDGNADDKVTIPATSDHVIYSTSKNSDDIIDTVMAKIRELVEWKEKGVITGDEFNRFKTKIINDARI